MSEVWRDVVGYKGCYQVSDLGRVRSIGRIGQLTPLLLTKKIRKVKISGSTGHREITLNRDGHRKTIRVGRLVLEAFCGSCPPGMVMCHGPNGRVDDRLCNLSWDTQSNNCGRDKARDGTTNRGENHHSAKLTKWDVRFIRLWLRAGYLTREIAAAFGITQRTVCSVRAGETWGWLA